MIVDAITKSASVEPTARRARVMKKMSRLSMSSQTTDRPDVLATTDALRISADNRCLLCVLMSTVCPLWLCLWMNHRIDTTQRTSPPSGGRADSRSTGDTVMRRGDDAATHDSKVHPTFRKGDSHISGFMQVRAQEHPS